MENSKNFLNRPFHLGNLKPEGQTITIVGGGFCGILTAHFLHQRQIPFRLLEKESTIGGKLQSLTHPLGLIETAANAIYSSNEVWELLEEVGVEATMAQEKLKRLVFRKGLYQSFPLSKLELIKILARLPKKPTDIHGSVKDFFLPLLGEHLCDEVLSPALSGIYATPAESLSFASVFPDYIQGSSYGAYFNSRRKKKKQQKKRPTSLSFPGGMQSFLTKLSEPFLDKIELGSKYQWKEGDKIIIATDAHHAGEILREGLPEASALLREMPYLSLTTTTVFSHHPIPQLEGSFGCLFPFNSQFYSQGVLHNSDIFENRVSHPSHRSYTLISKGNDIKKIRSDFDRLGGRGLIDIQSKTWEKALPLYGKKREELLKDLRPRLAEQKDIAIIGNYPSAISLREMLPGIRTLCEQI